MKKPGEYTKGPMGHMLDLRKSMGLLGVTAREWCRAFDAGDMVALNPLTTLVGEHSQDACDAALAVAAAQLDGSAPKG